MSLFGKLFGGGLRAKLEKGTTLVKVGLATRLSHRYKNRYDEDFALELAVAVSNTVFSDAPANEQSRDFLKRNRALVEQETRELSKDQRTCHVVTQMVRARIVVPYSKGDMNYETLLGPLETLQRYGILVPGGDAPSLDTLIPLVSEYYLTRDSEANS